MKKIFLWGIGSFVVCGILWVVSVIFTILTLGKWSLAANIFGYAAVSALPLTMVLMLIKKLRN